MPKSKPYTFSSLARETGVDRREVRVLAIEHGIGFSDFLGANVVDEREVEPFRSILLEYRRKAESRGCSRRAVAATA